MTIIALLLMISSLSTASAENEIDYDAYRNNLDFLKEDKEDWVCVDHAVNYSRHNPEWGIVILSPSPHFNLQPHMTNYMIEGNTLLIHEAQVNHTYELKIVNGSMNIPYYEDFPDIFIKQWEGATYFHFIPDESDVIRVYVTLKDNRDEFFDYENLSRSDFTNTTVEAVYNASVTTAGNSSGSMIDNTSISCNTITDDHHIANANEPKSHVAKFIQFLKTIFIGSII